MSSVPPAKSTRVGACDSMVIGNGGTNDCGGGCYAAAPQHFLYFLPLPQRQGSLQRNLHSPLVNFVSAANAVNNHSLVLRRSFVNDPPVAHAQLEESFPVPAERQRGNIFKVIHKPLDPAHNPRLDRRISFARSSSAWGVIRNRQRPMQTQ